MRPGCGNGAPYFCLLPFSEEFRPPLFKYIKPQERARNKNSDPTRGLRTQKRCRCRMHLVVTHGRAGDELKPTAEGKTEGL